MTYILLLNLLPQSNPSHLYLHLLAKANQTVKQNFDGVGCMIGEGNGTPLQYSCLENPMDGGAW